MTEAEASASCQPQLTLPHHLLVSIKSGGSAIVFHVIFSQRFLFELGIEGVGEELSVAEGFALFFREALGGAALGIAFGFGLPPSQPPVSVFIPPMSTK